MTQHGRRLHTSTVMADKVESPPTLTPTSTASHTASTATPHPHECTPKCQKTHVTVQKKMVAPNKNLMRKVQRKVTQHIRMGLGVGGDKKKSCSIPLPLGNRMLDLDAFPLNFCLTCKQSKNHSLEHSSYMLLVRMLRTRSRGLAKSTLNSGFVQQLS